MTKPCEYCGTPFEPKRATARFHTDACRKAFAREGGPAAISTKVAQDMKDTQAWVEKQQPEDETILKDLTYKVPKKKLVEATPELKDMLPAERRTELTRLMNERMAAKGLPLMSDKPDPVVFIPTGIGAIDGITADADEKKVGGIPRKHITEIFGPKGTGKSSLMRYIANNLSELSIFYIDAENGLIDPPEHIVISKATDLSTIDALIYEAVSSGLFDIVIVDSIAALTTSKEMEDGKDTMGGKAKAMAGMVRRVNANLRPIGSDGYPDPSLGTAVIFINQLRDTMASFGVKEYTPGGRSIEYAASLRLELRSAKADRIVKDGANVGQKVRVKVEKSRFGPPGQTAAYKMMYKDLK